MIKVLKRLRNKRIYICKLEQLLDWLKVIKIKELFDYPTMQMGVEIVGALSAS